MSTFKGTYQKVMEFLRMADCHTRGMRPGVWEISRGGSPCGEIHLCGEEEVVLVERPILEWACNKAGLIRL